MQTILITGGSGLLGTHLTNILLNKGYKVIILGRKNNVSSTPNLSFATWDLHTQTIDEDCIKRADVIVNLAGANVGAERWTDNRKKEILESRIKAGSLIVKSLQNIPNNVRTVVQSSATGWYKAHDDDKKNEEQEAPNTDFLGNTCKLWEDSITGATHLNKRLVILRFGIILSNLGGALKEFIKPLTFRFAPILGNGKQKISWVHIEDAAQIIIYAIENNAIEGTFNAVAPEVTTNKNLMRVLANKICGKWHLPFNVPSILLKIVLGGMSEEVLKNTNVSSDKLIKAGYNFKFFNLNDALQHLIENKKV